MRVQLPVALLVVVCVAVSHSALISSSVRRQITKLNVQIDIAHDLLETDCPTRAKRSLENSTQRLSTDLQILKLHYERLVQELIQCRAYIAATTKPIDCQQLHENGITTPGVYTLHPRGYDSFEAWCDFDASHGWTVIQRRRDHEDFFHNWVTYKAGFGNLNESYWLGNDNIHALTQTNQMLNIFLRRYDGGEASANYTTFAVANERDLYKLTISGYSGNSNHDAMAIHNNMNFSAKDRDNDVWSNHCADRYKGGWWYKSCHHANLNGLYCASGTANTSCAVWYGSFAGHSTSLSQIVMRVTRD